MLAGVDGCRGGWIVASRDGVALPRISFVSAFAQLVAAIDRYEVVIVDIPIGLMESGPRCCDRLARDLLGPRRSSVFPAPTRAMLPARDWAQAAALRLATEGKSCSKQAAAILPKVREVDSCLTPQHQLRIREGHPELSFAAMNGGVPLQFSKKCAEGRSQRVWLLDPHFPGLVIPRSSVAGDIIDALALLWSAERVAQRIHLELPGKPELDERGLRAEIVA